MIFLEITFVRLERDFEQRKLTLAALIDAQDRSCGRGRAGAQQRSQGKQRSPRAARTAREATGRTLEKDDRRTGEAPQTPAGQH
jgi:hypothetical protein